MKKTVALFLAVLLMMCGMTAVSAVGVPVMNADNYDPWEFDPDEVVEYLPWEQDDFFGIADGWVRTKDVLDGRVRAARAYDAQGRLLKDVHYQNGKADIAWTYAYDKNGNMIKEVEKSSAGYSCVYAYTYDKNGNKIKEVWKSANGNSTVDAYAYDKNGNVIKNVWKSSDGSKGVITWARAYDKIGTLRKLTIVSKRSDGDVYKEVWVFDGNGRLIKYTEKEGGATFVAGQGRLC